MNGQVARDRAKTNLLASIDDLISNTQTELEELIGSYEKQRILQDNIEIIKAYDKYFKAEELGYIENYERDNVKDYAAKRETFEARIRTLIIIKEKSYKQGKGLSAPYVLKTNCRKFVEEE